MKTFVVSPENKGQRLDQWLAKKNPEYSRSAWQKKINAGEVSIANKHATPHHILKEGERINIVIKKHTRTPKLKPSELLRLLFEDKHYAVVEKPAGWVVHAGTGKAEHLITEALAYQFKGKLSTAGGKDRPGIVHRLDKDTSGLLVVAKTNPAHRALVKQFEDRTVQKEYIALIEGHLFPDRGSIEAPLQRSKKHRKKIQISSRGEGRYALTHYKVKNRFEKPFPTTLIEIQIATGRTHQIRVHLEAIGHPVMGDKVYGNNSEAKGNRIGLHRQFLHAASLKFRSPSTQKKVHYRSKLPSDLKEALTRLS